MVKHLIAREALEGEDRLELFLLRVNTSRDTYSKLRDLGRFLVSLLHDGNLPDVERQRVVRQVVVEHAVIVQMARAASVEALETHVDTRLRFLWSFSDRALTVSSKQRVHSSL